MDFDFLKKKLDERQNSGNLRQLPGQINLIDFVSNDYLGLARNGQLAQNIRKREKTDTPIVGSTGSRLLSGNHPYYTQTEDFLRSTFEAESVLIFNSGYHANQAVVSSVPQKGDTIIYDQLAHVCLKEGAWLSKADTIAFRHNDMDDLEQKLGQANGRKFVVTETIFSMDGDIAPLKEIINLCDRYQGYLIIDEAHSTGAYGKNGTGLLQEFNLSSRAFARVYTFGKSMGVHGACVAGDKVLIDYLINFARPFIYTTALPPISLISIEESFRYLASHIDLQQILQAKIEMFTAQFPDSLSKTAIQPILMGSNQKAREASKQLSKHGFDVRPILSPTVRRGSERLRISLHTFNTSDQIDQLSSTLKNIL